MTAAKTEIGLSGPFFRGDVQRNLKSNIAELVERWAEEGEKVAVQLLQAGNSTRSPITALGDHASAHVRGRAKSIQGTKWTYHMVVSINNHGYDATQGISLMAASAETERQTHTFRKVASALRRSRKLAEADLTRQFGGT